MPECAAPGSELDQPIVIGRHAYADQYAATDFVVPGAGKLTMTFTPADGGAPVSRKVFDFKGGGVAIGMYNLDEFDQRFCALLLQLRAAARTGRSTCRPRTPFSRPMTGASRTSSRRCSNSEFAAAFKERNLTYEHRLIDDMVALALKWNGGFVWACKNYDGDVQSDTFARASARSA